MSDVFELKRSHTICLMCGVATYGVGTYVLVESEGFLRGWYCPIHAPKMGCLRPVVEPDETIEEVLVPKGRPPIIEAEDGFLVTINTDGNVVVFHEELGINFNTHHTDIEDLADKLAWATQASAALTDRTPF